MLDGWPSVVNAHLFSPGTWLFLDGGELKLGVIRDSTLVGTNDFIMFSETMEAVAFHGSESLMLAMTLCASGASSAPIDVHSSVCPQGS